MIGQTLRQYRIINILGQGGMGVVWKAHDSVLDRDVALKVMPVDEAGAATRKERFFREAKAASALNHPGIITIYEINADKGIDFIAMEYVEGRTLAAQLRLGRMAIDQVTDVAIQIADAVGRAHGAGIVHRDLKPSNVMLTDDGRVKVLDFGVAKMGRPVVGEPDTETMAALTEAGTTVGTIGYMSPEQAIGDSVDARSDVFSFGVILYEMLAGTLPFEAGNRSDVLRKLHFEQPAPLTSLRSDIPAPIAATVMRALAKKPADRFSNLTEMAAALRAGTSNPSARAGFLAPGRDAFTWSATSRRAAIAGLGVLLIAALIGAWAWRSRSTTVSSVASDLPRTSIAVLPFADMSPGKDNEYFGDGLAEDIINALTKIDGLKVIARTSAFSFKGQTTDIRTIANKLGVTTVLEGSVRKEGSRIRVTAELIAAADGSQLWSQQFDRELTDVFAVQDEMTAAISGVLQTKFSPAPAARAHTPSIEAYEAYLKGRHYQFSYTAEHQAMSREFFKQAIAADPQFALAQHGLSLFYYTLAMFSLMPAHDAMPLVRAGANKALEIDPALPESHAMLGMVAGGYDYDWREAGRQFDVVMASPTVSPLNRASYATNLLLYTGRPEEAVTELKRAATEDPLSTTVRQQLAVALLSAGRDAEAAEQLRQTLEIDDRFRSAISMQALRLAWRGDWVAARARAEEAYRLEPKGPVVIGELAAMLIRTGERDRGSRLRAQLGDGTAYGAPLALMTFYLLTGDVDQAANWADKAIDQRSPGVLQFVHLPLVKALRASPRWPALAARMNLPH